MKRDDTQKKFNKLARISCSSKSVKNVSTAWKTSKKAKNGAQIT